MHPSIHNLNWLPLHGSKYLNKIPTNTFALFIEDYQICILKQIMCSTYLYYSYCLYTHVYIHHKDIHPWQNHRVGWYSGKFPDSSVQIFLVHMLQAKVVHICFCFSNNMGDHIQNKQTFSYFIEIIRFFKMQAIF